MLRKLNIATSRSSSPRNVYQKCADKGWKKILQQLLLFAFFILPKPCSAQQLITYSYDAAGNRVSKTVRTVFAQSGSDRQSQNSEGCTSGIGVYLAYNDNILHLFAPGCCEKAPCDYVICSVSGQVISKGRMTREACEINTRNFTRGTYVIHLTFNKEQESWKLYKE